MSEAERAGHAAPIYYSLGESCKANSVNSLTHILSNARNKAVRLPTPDEFADFSTVPAGGCVLKQSGVKLKSENDADCRTKSPLH